MRALTAGLAVGSLLAGGACDASDPPEPDRFTACEVLTRDEVSDVLERPVGPPTEGSGAATDALAGRSGCAWSSTDGHAAILIELVRTADMATSVRRTGFSAAARFAAIRDASPDAPAPVVKGGQARFLESEASMHVLVGGSYLTIEVAATPPDVIEPLAVDLARLAVDRLRRADGAD